MSSVQAPVVETTKLSRRFGHIVAANEIDLEMVAVVVIATRMYPRLTE